LLWILLILMFVSIYNLFTDSGAKENETDVKTFKAEIASAEAARKQARDALEQYEQALSEARTEAHKMLDDAKVQQSKLAADLRAKADIELTEMRERAMRDIDAAKRTALNEIYGQAAELATGIAAKILKREIAEQDQQALLEESLAELQTS